MIQLLSNLILPAPAAGARCLRLIGTDICRPLPVRPAAAGPVGRWCRAAADWLKRHMARKALDRLDVHLLDDIGLAVERQSAEARPQVHLSLPLPDRMR